MNKLDNNKKQHSEFKIVNKGGRLQKGKMFFELYINYGWNGNRYVFSHFQSFLFKGQNKHAVATILINIKRYYYFLKEWGTKLGFTLSKQKVDKHQFPKIYQKVKKHDKKIFLQ